MKKVVTLLSKALLTLLGLPLLYVLVSLLLTIIPISDEETSQPKEHTIYLTTNGVHADVLLPKQLISPIVLEDQIQKPKDRYFAFGWGEENFYLNTPTWGDLKFSTAFQAAFLESNTVVHVTRYKQKRATWIPVTITNDQLQKLNTYIAATFDQSSGSKELVHGATYTPDRDNFYRAHGNYMFYRTCNSWLNKGLKESGLKGSLWTPFDFGVLRWYD